MAKRGSGGPPAPRNYTLAVVEEIGEYAAGVLAGTAVASIIGALRAGAVNGLKGSILSSLFGTRPKTETATPDDLTAAPKKFSGMVKTASKDEKLAQLAQQLMQKELDIRSTNMTEAEKFAAIQRERKEFENAVKDRIIELSKEGYDKTVLKLDEGERDDWDKWVLSLPPDRRQEFESRKAQIKSVDLMRDILRAKGAFVRFDILMSRLPRLSIAEQARNMIEAAVAGSGESVETALNAASKRITSSADMVPRRFTNRSRFFRG